jgi:hypothetical protein
MDRCPVEDENLSAGYVSETEPDLIASELEMGAR